MKKFLVGASVAITLLGLSASAALARTAPPTPKEKRAAAQLLLKSYVPPTFTKTGHTKPVSGRSAKDLRSELLITTPQVLASGVCGSVTGSIDSTCVRLKATELAEKNLIQRGLMLQGKIKYASSSSSSSSAR